MYLYAGTSHKRVQYSSTELALKFYVGNVAM